MTKKKNNQKKSFEAGRLQTKKVLVNLFLCLLLGLCFFQFSCSISGNDPLVSEISMKTEKTTSDNKIGITTSDSIGEMIEYFSASAEKVGPGQIVTISWKIKNAVSFDVNGFDKMVDRVLKMEDSYAIYPTENRQCSLTAFSANGKTETATLSIAVDENLPVILDFSADHYVVNIGEEVMISWNIQNAIAVELEGWEKMPDRVFNLVDQLAAYPYETTHFSIYAYGNDGKYVKKTIIITVTENNVPVINSFIASNTRISKGQIVVFNWSTSNSESCTILTSLGHKISNRPTSGSLALTPNQSMLVTLVAIDINGNKSMENINIIVSD